MVCSSYPPSLDTSKDKGREENDTSQSPTPTSTSASGTFNHSIDLEAQISQSPTLHDANKTGQHKWSTYLNKDIPHDHYLEAQLLLLSFSTGIMDAVSFATYSVFVSKQTGNTIFLALSALSHDSIQQTEPNVAISFFLFIAGAAIFGHLGHSLGQKRRLWLLVSNTLQTVLIFASAALRYWTPDQHTGPVALGVIAMLSFAFGGQIAMAMCMKVPDLNTTMVTGAIVQLATDGRLFARANAARNRRLMFILFLLAGGFVGSVCARFLDAAVGILVVALVKSVVTGMFFVGGTSIVSREVGSESE